MSEFPISESMQAFQRPGDGLADFEVQKAHVGHAQPVDLAIIGEVGLRKTAAGEAEENTVTPANQAEGDSLSRARGLYNAVDPNEWLLGIGENAAAAQKAVDSLSPEELVDFDNWRLESAAKRGKNLFVMLSDAETNEFGQKVIEPEQLAEFIGALESRGVHVSTEKPGQEQIEAGIEGAKRLVESGQAERVQRAMKYTPNEIVKTLRNNPDQKEYAVIEGGMLFIDPSQITNTAGFDSWVGKGPKSYTKSNGVHVDGQSKNAIIDYATRSSQLPPLESGALCVILRPTGEPIIFVDFSAHRTAAAKLRGEPLAFKTVTIYKMPV